MSRLLSLFFVLVFATTACGDKKSSEEGRASETFDGANVASASPSERAVADYFLEKEDLEPSVSEEQAHCLGKDIVEEIGDERLDVLGSTVDLKERLIELDLEQAERQSIHTALIGCVDYIKSFSTSLSENGLSEQEATCVAEKAEEAGIEEVWASSISKVPYAGDYRGGISGMSEWKQACEMGG